MPWILMVIIQLVMPNASLLGHLCGIISALLIKFCGLYVLMPSYEWIKDFDDSYASGLERKVTYFKGTEAISVDFNS